MMPQRFRKRPVVIEAVQLTWANWSEICDFVPKPWFVQGVVVWLDDDGRPMPKSETNFKAGDKALGLILKTLEGEEFLATGGDWIIKGVNGEFYPCKPDIFAKTYDPADEMPATGKGDPIPVHICSESPDYRSLREQIDDFASTYYGPFLCEGCGSPNRACRP